MRERRTTLDKVRYGDVMRGVKNKDARYMVVTGAIEDELTITCLQPSASLSEWAYLDTRPALIKRPASSVAVILVSDDE